MILFAESGLDFPSLQGDLEYMPYCHSNPAEAFVKANEMISKLIGRRAGISVETVVREEPPQRTELKAAAPEPEPEPSPDAEPAESPLRAVIKKVFDALAVGDWQNAEEGY